jgi:integrase
MLTPTVKVPCCARIGIERSLRGSLRLSELLALRWRDVDFDNLELSVIRSIWHQVVGGCKTEASAKPVPLDGYMAEDLLRLAAPEHISVG